MPMATEADLELGRLELRHALYLRAFDVVVRIIEKGIPWGAAVLIAYFTARAADSLAGKVTLADIGVRVLASVRLSEILPYLVGLGGVGYGLGQRKLRRDHIENSSKHTRALERNIDPGRTSSGLTSRGATHPRDKA